MHSDMLSEVTYHLEPGYIYMSSKGDVIRTVVGSCVAVCMWDKRRKFGGMSHFLYPEIKEKSKATACYGNVAVPMLLKLMKDTGSRKKDIVAQIFGGGKLHDATKSNVGDENIAIARRMLEPKGIPIISEDVGGSMGRKILFDTASGQVAILKVHRIRQSDWHDADLSKNAGRAG